MRLLSLIILGASLAFSSASAQTAALEVTPSPADSMQKITIRLSGTEQSRCVPDDPSVAIIKRTIILRYRITLPICESVATPYAHLTTLGPLAAGLYTVQAIFGNGSVPMAETSLTVREAAVPFRITPRAAPKTTGGKVTFQNTRIFCESGIPNCERREVFFGDKPAVVDRVSDLFSEFTVTAPPHDADFVDVTIRFPDGTSSTSQRGFHYFDPAAPPDPALFERILLPITQDVRGAFGSDFRVSLAVYNDNRYFVPMWRPVGQEPALAPAALSTLRTGKPNGALIFPLREAAEVLYFSSNARDVSRVAETFGTEIPIVREADIRAGHSEMPVVPADPNFRLNLRLYGVDAKPGSVHVSVHSPDNRIFFGDSDVELHASGNPEEPAFAMLSNLRAAFPGLQEISSGSFRVHLQGAFGYRYWALLTVTNNTTQQITTITPQ